MTVLIVGASVAGIRTAQSLRAAGYDEKIVVLGEESHAPYDKPPLSKQMLEHDAGEPAALLPAAQLELLQLELRLGARAVALDPERRIVTTADGAATGYTHLVIATGSYPRTLPGADELSGVHTLRTYTDAVALRGEIDRARHVAVIGAGFIGAEFASAARARGVPVTLIEAQPTPLAHVFGDVVGGALSELHTQAGAVLLTGASVAGLRGEGAVHTVELTDGVLVPADVVVVGIGARPATDWLESSGLPLQDGVLCDAALRVRGHSDVYAAGDVARFRHPFYDEDLRIEHWTNANEHGAIVAAGITGRDLPAPSVPYVWSDQYGRRIQIVGRPATGELAGIVGGVEPGQSLGAVFATAGGTVVGAVVLDNPKLFMRLRKAVAQRLDVSDVPLHAAVAT
jgi:NADPH-dependent 2,4-dienoyl-CoA reductase/sulfur reductase-like enzyme